MARRGRHMSYALQKAMDQATGETLLNSPRQMGKARVSAPLFGRVVGRGRGARDRQARDDRREHLGAATTANLTVIKPLDDRSRSSAPSAICSIGLCRPGVGRAPAGHHSAERPHVPGRPARKAPALECRGHHAATTAVPPAGSTEFPLVVQPHAVREIRMATP